MNHQIVIVDVESTCWEGKTPPGQQSEIIEIGVCLLDTSTRAISATKSILVKPARSKVSEFCTALTTLTQEQVNAGIPFADACALLEIEYQTKDRVWASWGDYDHRMFEMQCASFGVEYPFGAQHINLKKLFTQVTGADHKMGMASALKAANLPLIGTHHRGDDDAHNIARLLAHMLSEYGQDILVLP